MRLGFSRVTVSLVALCAASGAVEFALHLRDDRFIRDLARRIVERAHVDNEGLSRDGSGRPFFRSSAAETLRSGKGLCGEVSRAFIVMARSLGIRAQRVNLVGAEMHVVAEAEIAPNLFAVVDAQNPPAIKDLEPLDQVILRPEYDDYSTLNLRRVHLSWLVPRLKLNVNAITGWLERPHLIRATLSLSLAGLVLLLALLRVWFRAWLHRRGWVHESNEHRLQAKGLRREDATRPT